MKLKKLAAGILAAVMAVTSAVVAPVTASAAGETIDVTVNIDASWFSGLIFQNESGSIVVNDNDVTLAGYWTQVNRQDWDGTANTDNQYTAAFGNSNEDGYAQAFTFKATPDTTYTAMLLFSDSGIDNMSYPLTVDTSDAVEGKLNIGITGPGAGNWVQTEDDGDGQSWIYTQECTTKILTKAEGIPDGTKVAINDNPPYNYQGMFSVNVDGLTSSSTGADIVTKASQIEISFPINGALSDGKAFDVANITYQVNPKIYSGNDWPWLTAGSGTYDAATKTVTIKADLASVIPAEYADYLLNSINVIAMVDYSAADAKVDMYIGDVTVKAIPAAAPETEEPTTEEPETEEPETEEPVAPTVDNVTATAGENSVTVQWDAVEGATNYRVFTYLDGKYAVAGETTDPYYYVGNLEAGTEYGFLVRAFVNDVWTAFTNDDVVYATPTAPIVTKPVISATPTANAGEVALAWEAVTNATNYRVFTYLDGKYAIVDETTETSYTVTDLEGGKEYGFLVRALVNNAWTAFDTAEDVAYATPAAPASTKPVFSVTIGVGSALVKWDAVAGATNYRVYTYRNGYVLAGETTETSFNVTGLAGGVEYGFLVRALVDGKWSAFTTEDNLYLTPDALKPVFSVGSGVNSAVVEWDAIDGATSYKVFTYRLNKYTLVTETEDTSYTVTGLVGGTEYGVLVRACVNGVWTAFTTADNIAVTPLAAAKPVVSVTDDGNDTLTVTWEAVDGATDYRVFTYINGKYAVAGETAELTYDVTVNVTEGGVLVRACVNGVWSPFTNSDVVEFTITA